MKRLFAALLLLTPLLAHGQTQQPVVNVETAPGGTCPSAYKGTQQERLTGRQYICKETSPGSWNWTYVGTDTDGDGVADIAERLAADGTNCAGSQVAVGVDEYGNAQCTVVAGTGDVVGPASSTDNAIVRFLGTTGREIDQATSNTPTISDTGVLSLATAGGLDLPESSSTTEGRISWDATNDDLKIGTGGSTQTVVAAPSSSTANTIPYYADATGNVLGSQSGLKVSSTATDYLIPGDLIGGNFWTINWEWNAYPASSNSQSIQGGIAGANEGKSMGLAMLTHLHYDNTDGWRFANRGDKGWRIFASRPMTQDKTESTINGEANNIIGWCAGGFSDTAMAGGFTDLLTGSEVLDQQGLCLLGGYKSGAGGLLFEGATYNDHEGVLTSADVTDDREWVLPDLGGTVAMTSQTSLGNPTPLTWNVTPGTCTGDGNAGALTVNGSNEIICSADDGGGGGTPGGLNTEIQYNNSGSFGGVPKITYNGTALTINAAANSTITLPQGPTPGVVTEGQIQWDTDDDKLSIGDGAAALKFWPIDEAASTDTYICTATKTADASPDKIVCGTDPASVGSGDITAVGDCTGPGACFDGAGAGAGTTLTFYGGFGNGVIAYDDANQEFDIDKTIHLPQTADIIGGGASGDLSIISTAQKGGIADNQKGFHFNYAQSSDPVICPYVFSSEYASLDYDVQQYCLATGWAIPDYAETTSPVIGTLRNVVTSYRLPGTAACTAGEVVGWNGGYDTGRLSCTATPLLDVEEQESVVVTDATSLDFLGVDFNVTAASKEANVSIGAAITRDAEWDTSAEIRTNLDSGDASYTGTGNMVFHDGPTFGNTGATFGSGIGTTPTDVIKMPQFAYLRSEVPVVTGVTGATAFLIGGEYATAPSGQLDNGFGWFYNARVGMGKINSNEWAFGQFLETNWDQNGPPGGPPVDEWLEYNWDFVPRGASVAWRPFYWVLDTHLLSNNGAVSTAQWKTHDTDTPVLMFGYDAAAGATGGILDINRAPTYSSTAAGKARAHYSDNAATVQASAYAFSADRYDGSTHAGTAGLEFGGIQSICDLNSTGTLHEYGYCRGNRTIAKLTGSHAVTTTTHHADELSGYGTTITIDPGTNVTANVDQVAGLNVTWGTIKDQASLFDTGFGVYIGAYPAVPTNQVQVNNRGGVAVLDQKCRAGDGANCATMFIQAQTGNDGTAGNLVFEGGSSTSGHLSFNNGYSHVWAQHYDATYTPNELYPLRHSKAGSWSAGSALNSDGRTSGDLFVTAASTAETAASLIDIDDGAFSITLTGSTTINDIDYCDTANKGKPLVVLCGAATATLNDNGVAAGNLKLYGDENFACGTDKMLSLLCDGTDWVETSRSIAAGTYALKSGNTYTGTHDFGSATALEVPNVAAASVSAAGQIAVDTSGNYGEQLIFHDGTDTNVVDPLRSLCAVIPDLAPTDDNFEFWMARSAVTVKGVACHCRGSCSVTANFALEDRAGNAMTHTTPTCSTGTSDSTWFAVTAANGLNAGEGIAFDVTNSVSPSTDEYTLCVSYTVDQR